MSPSTPQQGMLPPLATSIKARRSSVTRSAGVGGVSRMSVRPLSCGSDLVTAAV
jgi:hypothetical protein